MPSLAAGTIIGSRVANRVTRIHTLALSAPIFSTGQAVTRDPSHQPAARKESAMKTIILFTGLLLMAGAALEVKPAEATDFSVTIVNTTHGAYFTPLLITAHDPDIQHCHWWP
jgi:hypothetical protein